MNQILQEPDPSPHPRLPVQPPKSKHPRPHTRRPAPSHRGSQNRKRVAFVASSLGPPIARWWRNAASPSSPRARGAPHHQHRCVRGAGLVEISAACPYPGEDHALHRIVSPASCRCGIYRHEFVAEQRDQGLMRAVAHRGAGILCGADAAAIPQIAGISTSSGTFRYHGIEVAEACATRCSAWSGFAAGRGGGSWGSRIAFRRRAELLFTSPRLPWRVEIRAQLEISGEGGTVPSLASNSRIGPRTPSLSPQCGARDHNR